MDQDSVDLLQELINIGAGRAAQSLNCLFDSHIALRVPVVKWLVHPDVGEIADCFAVWGQTELAVVHIGVVGELPGSVKLVISAADGDRLVAQMHNGVPRQEGLTHTADLLKEIGNIIINGLIGTFGNLLEINLAYRLPTFMKVKMDRLFGAEKDVPVVFAMVEFGIEKLEIRGHFIIVFEVENTQMLHDMLARYCRKQVG